MTGIDRSGVHPGYWASPWAVECGGNRRQKTSTASLGAAAGDATVTTVRNGRWNVMVVRRDPGEWFLSGTMAAFHGDPPFGWVQRLDPESLEPVAESPHLPCGDHVWCGSVAAHANGSLINVNGSYLHRLSPDCEVMAEAKLPADRAHNGLLVLSDGTVVTKDLRLAAHGESTITRLDPESLDLVHAPLVMPEGSMGRIAADVTIDGEFIYVPGTTKVFRIVVEADALVVDDDWQPEYRSDETQGMAWDSCLSEGHAWIMDNGDIAGVRALFDQHPNGRSRVLLARRSAGDVRRRGRARSVCCESISRRANSRTRHRSTRWVVASSHRRSISRTGRRWCVGTASTAVSRRSTTPRSRRGGWPTSVRPCSRWRSPGAVSW